MNRRERLLADFYPETRFGGFSNIDGTVAFYSRVNALLARDDTVVDFGCGRGAYSEDPVAYRRDLRVLKGKAGRVIGLDADPLAAQNPFLDQFYRLENTCWPLPDSTANLVLSDNVLEHLPEPARFFSEASRVLKAGGRLCLRTPNSWSYVALFSRLIPNRSHAAVLKRVKKGTQEQDVFPTYYRCNSLPALRRALAQNGLDGTAFGYEAEPSYMAFSGWTYFLGVIHQRFAPGFLRPAIFAFARKMGSA